MEKYQMIAKTLAGLENVLVKELELLGAEKIEKRKRAVLFEGSDSLMMEANLSLRSAISILIPLLEFEAKDEYQLYDQVFAIQWESIFELKNTFSISATVSGEIFTHSKYVALKTKDAIADRFRMKTKRRPDVDIVDADYQLNVHIQHKSCTISLNSSGPSLNRRGYRLKSNEAPINEVLAAGIILLSGWDQKTDFYDPMSGSGTFGIEAALMANKIPPGLNRKFGFQRWSDYDYKLFHEIHEKLQNQIISSDVNIFCSDLLTESMDYISMNAERAGVSDNLKMQKEDFFSSKKQGDKGFLFFNPPYGERLSIDQINAFYKQIGDQLKQQYQNCEAWIISSNLDALKFFGLKPTSRTQLYNGGLECRLNHYKLYAGVKKTAKELENGNATEN